MYADMSVVLLIMEVMMMINDETRRKLEELSLGEMIHALEIQSGQQSLPSGIPDNLSSCIDKTPDLQS